MIIPVKKLKNGFELPVYGLGMGGKREVSKELDAKEIETIQKAFELGLSHVDTAERYADGHAEELLGKAMNGFDRKKLLIATKVASENQSRDGMFRAVEGSLKRLNTDYIDLYLLHRYPDRSLSIKEAVETLNELVEQKVVKNIGVCNLSPKLFDEAQKYSNRKLVCDQVHYNVQIREAEKRGVLKYCQENDIFLVAWRPLEKGEFLSVPIFIDLAKKYSKTPAQIAINWLIAQENVVAISRTSNVKHLEENLGALDWALEPEDIEKLRESFPNQLDISYGEPLDNIQG